MQHSRAVDFDDGVAMVVTDLHGHGDIFDHLIEKFLRLRDLGLVDRLILCGDLIHAYQPADDSLRMILETMRWQQDLGAGVVTLLMGNHELPHVYSITLSKGSREFTAPFERAMVKSGQREAIMDFLLGLPMAARTQAGVFITHAGATPIIKTAQDADRWLTFDHRALLMLADHKLQNGYDLDALKRDDNYLAAAQHYLAISGPDDPRLHHFLRGQLISQTEDEFRFLWDVLFSRCEQAFADNHAAYTDVVLPNFLKAISAISPHEQRVLVSGHMTTHGGHDWIGRQQLRLATYAHATPHEAGQYLLLDCAAPVENAAELVAHLHPTLR